MPHVPNEASDLQLAEELIFAPHNLRCERFSRMETLAGKTPDFRVMSGNRLVAYCEVKSPRDDWMNELLAVAEPGQIVGGLRDDPTFNRIARNVTKAAKQFDAVNYSREVPNILVFVNHDEKASYRDLDETLTGTFRGSKGERFTTMTHISNGILGEIKCKIDLYVWIDYQTRRLQGYILNETAPDTVTLLCEMLALNKSAIKS